MTTLLEELLAVETDEIAGWPKADQDWYYATLQLQLNLRSPADFAVAHSNGRWQPYRHAVVTSNAIVDMVEHDSCDVLIIDQPVRHGKTELCSRKTPAWFLSKYPDRRVLLASYEGDFAATHGRVVRDIIDEHGAQYGIGVSPGSKAAARWDLTNGIGGMGTAGSNGPIIGKGGHLMIVDDPTKNFDEANSKVYREKLWDWWQNVWLGRREPGAKLLLIMSRWHQDDLVGRLLTHDIGMRINHLRMPAVAEEGDDDPLGRKEGEALCPERYDEEALAATQKAVGPTAWASQYQQRPQLRGGGMLKASLFQGFVRQDYGDDSYYEVDGRRVHTKTCSRFSMMDTAYTNKKQSDYTVMGTFGLGSDDEGVPILLVLNVERRRTGVAEHAPMLMSTWDQWKPAWVGIEKQAATLSMFLEAQRQGVVVRWLKPDKSKIARAETVRGLLDSGQVWVPKGATWLAKFLDECAMFPVGEHDDQVDVLAYAGIEVVARSTRPRHMPAPAKSAEDVIWERVQKMHNPKRRHPVLGNGW